MQHRRSSNCDDRYMPGFRISSELQASLHAIYPGQLDVHENEGWKRLLSELDALFSGIAFNGLVTLGLQDVAQQPATFLIILDD